MRRQRYVTIIFISILLFTLTVLCANASWFIQEKGEKVAEQYTSTGSAAAVTESDYFDLTFTYDGTAHEPKLNETGKTAFGEDTEFTFTFLGGEAANGGGVINSTVADLAGVLAGTHRYKVTETATGQVIYDNLQITVDPYKLTLGDLSYSPYAFAGQPVADAKYTVYGINNQKIATVDATLSGNVSYDAFTAGTSKTSSHTQQITAHFDSTKLVLTGTYDKINYIAPSDKTETKDFSLTILPTCYDNDGTTTTYYGTLNQALAATVNKTTTLVAMQSFTHTSGTYTAKVNGTGNYEHVIGGDPDMDLYADDDTTNNIIDKTIGANVTLRLPYDTANETTAFRTDPNDPTTDAEFLITDARFQSTASTTLEQQKTILSTTRRNNATYLKNEVTVAADVTLQNKGTIEIAGQISGGNGGDHVNSMVAGYHAQIKMMDNAVINSDGDILCYGFITEASENNDSKVIANNGSKITTIFSVSEHRGGSNFGAIYIAGMKTAPFNRFWIESVSSELTVNYGAELLGRVDLDAGGAHNISNIKLIGIDNTYLISLAQGASVIAKYHHNYTKVTETNRTTALEIKGSASFNSLEITIELGIRSKYGDFIAGLASLAGITDPMTLSTESVLFPISGYYQVTLSPINETTSATVTLNNDIKLLPGATLTVSKGVTLSGESQQMAVYDSMHCASAIGAAAAYQFTDPAVFTVNGALNVGTFGGKIYTNQEGAKVNTTSATIQAGELSSVTALKISTSDFNKGDAKWDYVAYTLSLQRYQSDGTVTTDFLSNQSAKEYIARVGSNGIGWCPTRATVALDANGGTVSPTTISGLITVDGFTPSQSLPTPTIDGGLDFLGWYTSSTLDDGTEYDAAKIVDDTTLYAKWPEMYTVTLDANNQTGRTYTYNGNTLTPGTSHTITTIKSPLNTTLTNFPVATANSNCNESYYLAGWSTSDDGTPASSYTVTGDATLFAIWKDKAKVTISDSNGIGYSVTIDGADVSVTNGTFYVIPGSKVTVTANEGGTSDCKNKEITSDTSVTISKDDSCLVEGTLITMADGTQKKVEELKVGDMLLAFNHVTGKTEAAPLIFNTHQDESARERNVLYLLFSNGEEVKIVASHGFFDLTLMQYVYITENNYNDFIGHSFYAMDSNGEAQTITLTDAYLNTETVRIFCPVTYFHMNSFANGVLNTPNIPGDITGLVNFFEYDSDLKYNEELMQADIEKYGLYTYDDFKDYISYEAYLSSPAVYLKVSVGKGMITHEEIVAVIQYLLAGSLID